MNSAPHNYEDDISSADREKSILEGIRSELGKAFVREVDGNELAVGTKTSRQFMSLNVFGYL